MLDANFQKDAVYRSEARGKRIGKVLLIHLFLLIV